MNECEVSENQQFDDTLESFFEPNSYNDMRITETSHSEPEFVCTVDGCHQRHAMPSMLLSHNGSDVGEEWTETYSVRRHGQIGNLRETFQESHIVDDMSNPDECGSQLNTCDQTKSHYNRHTTVTSYECPECGKTYRQKSSLEGHINTIHNNIKPYVCPEPGCQYRTAYKCNLYKHSKSHGDHLASLTCGWPQCNYVTFRRSDFRRHMSTHTHERAYECQHSGCGKKFKTKYTLKHHIETHSEYKNYVCDCGKRFKTKHYLWVHNYMVHRIKGYRYKKKLVN